MASVDGFKLLADAHDYLRTVVRGVPADAWGNPTPCAEWTVRQVFNHARLDQLALVMQITDIGPLSDPFSPEDAVGADPGADLDSALLTATTAWESGRQAEFVPTPMGPMPARVGAAAGALDAALHAWDIAVATGQRESAPLSDELASGLEDIANQIVDFVRNSFGKYGPVIEVGSDASPADKLLGFSGRNPAWAPTTS